MQSVMSRLGGWLVTLAIMCPTVSLAQELPSAIGVTLAFPELSRPFDRPIAMLQAPGRRDRWYVAEQAGRVLVFENAADATDVGVVADISGRIASGPNEAGLLGFAFHPGFQSNREIFLSYTVRGSGRGVALTSVISRFRMVDDDGLVIDPRSEEIILTIDQPFANHNGGHIVFGPDGFLYAGFGDGGSAGDPEGNGQNLDTLLGTLIRIDVDRGAPYAVPDDNPFVAGGGRAEIYAYGLRNPWRWSFDRETGDLWLADVGQNRWEEVDQITAGGNYGWNRREGAHEFERTSAASSDLIEPVAEYSHNLGCSVTGGFVYRGKALPDLTGWFVYGDFCSGRIWATRPDGQTLELLRVGLSIAAFAQDAEGELYILDHGRGRIARLVPG